MPRTKQTIAAVKTPAVKEQTKAAKTVVEIETQYVAPTATEALASLYAITEVTSSSLHAATKLDHRCVAGFYTFTNIVRGQLSRDLDEMQTQRLNDEITHEQWLVAKQQAIDDRNFFRDLGGKDEFMNSDESEAWRIEADSLRTEIATARDALVNAWSELLRHRMNEKITGSYAWQPLIHSQEQMKLKTRAESLLSRMRVIAGKFVPLRDKIWDHFKDRVLARLEKQLESDDSSSFVSSYLRAQERGEEPYRPHGWDIREVDDFIKAFVERKRAS